MRNQSAKALEELVTGRKPLIAVQDLDECVVLVRLESLAKLTTIDSHDPLPAPGLLEEVA